MATQGTLALLIEVNDTSYGYRHLTCRPMFISPDRKGYVGPCDFSHEGERYLVGLRVTCQLDTTAPIFPYAQYVEYHDVTIRSAQHAAEVAKTLKSVESQLAKMAEREGYLNDDYPLFCLRVARALGIQYFAWWNTHQAKYTLWGLPDGQQLIASHIVDWQHKHNNVANVA